LDTRLVAKAFSRDMQKIWFSAALGILVLGVSLRLRSSSFIAPPQLFGYLQVASAIMALTFAAISLLRFRSDRDRFSLFLGLAFLISGISILFTIPGLFGGLRDISPGSLRRRTPWPWWLARSLFAFLLISAAIVGRRVSTTIQPLREIVLTLMIAVGFGVLGTAAYQRLPASWVVQPSAAVRRPENLAMALAFLIPAIGFGRRFKKTGLPSDAGIFLAAILNVVCHIISSESQKSMDAAFMVGQGFKMLGYAAALGGMLVQSARLYDEVRSLAIKDSLTGLANHRFLVGVIDSEIHRSMRSGHPFTILLLDLDGLKKINDQYGHATGSQAICRLADVLRVVCRGTDTAGRFGGDEFVLVLPDTGEESAQRVRARIRAQLANDSVLPPLSVSVGLAVYPVDGMSLTALLDAADKSLYAMKRHLDLHLVSSKA
jgi:diguanylate cyclase (GGDEF)-like protein